MTLKTILGVAATVVSAASFVPYIIALIRKEVKPHSFSWLIWAMTLGVAAAAQWVSGAGAGLWATTIDTVCCFGIGIAGLIAGEHKITRGDWACMAFVALAIPVWVITKNPLGSVVIVSIIDAVAFYPTLRKSWNAPREENASIFAISAFGLILAIGALENISVVNWLYPATMMISNVVLVSVLVGRRKALNSQWPKAPEDR